MANKTPRWKVITCLFLARRIYRFFFGHLERHLSAILKTASDEYCLWKREKLDIRISSLRPSQFTCTLKSLSLEKCLEYKMVAKSYITEVIHWWREFHTTQGDKTKSPKIDSFWDPRGFGAGGFKTSSQPFSSLSCTQEMYFFTLSSR